MKKFLFVTAILLFSISNFTFAKDEYPGPDVVSSWVCHGTEPMECINSYGKKVGEHGRLLFPVYYKRSSSGDLCNSGSSVTIRECEVKEYTRDGKPSRDSRSESDVTTSGGFATDHY